MKPVEATILIAGIGNIFLGDDGFGPAVAQRCLQLDWPPNVIVCDFGIRSFDLACALLPTGSGGWSAAILVDTIARGSAAGTLFHLELTPEAAADSLSTALDGHSLDLPSVLQTARRMAADTGSTLPRLHLIGCEPLRFDPSEATGDESPNPGALVGWNASLPLTPTVAGAVEPAVEMVRQLAARLQFDKEVFV